MSSSSDFPALILLVIICIGGTIILRWNFKKTRQILGKWAKDNNYQILSSEHRIFTKGPFFWTSSRQQSVYYVVVRDSHGHEKSGWLRCGDYWFGMLIDRVEVIWER
jgi:hypothetical protein